MRPEIVMRYLGFILLFNALFMLISSVISLMQAESSFYALIFSSTVAFLFGIFPLLFVSSTPKITNQEGLVIVVFGWL
ncbi:MAG: TrkH family potassium uptake protein, partial [Desulfobacterales bacterium]